MRGVLMLILAAFTLKTKVLIISQYSLFVLTQVVRQSNRSPGLRVYLSHVPTSPHLVPIRVLPGGSTALLYPTQTMDRLQDSPLRAHLQDCRRILRVTGMCVCVCVCVCVCTSMYVCMYACMYVCMYVCVYVCMYVCMYVCIYVRVYAYMYVCICVCMHVCMYVRICVCMCMYVCIYVCTHVRNTRA
jgi:hypothetical protein